MWSIYACTPTCIGHMPLRRSTVSMCFVKPPVCFDLEDALLMQQAEKQYGKKILVNQFVKFDPAYTYLYEAHRQQKYGKLNMHSNSLLDDLSACFH